MALSKTDLAILRNDPAYEIAIQKSAQKVAKAEADIRAKFEPKFAALEAAYQAARLALGEKRNVAIDVVKDKFHSEQSAIRARAVKRLKLQHVDILDEEGLAR
jgi:hypothetical protein